MTHPDTEVITRTHIKLANGDHLFCSESYQDVYDRVVAARDAHFLCADDKMSNPLSLPLVNVRLAMRMGPEEDAEVAVVDACFNPMHLVSMFRAHPDV